MGLLSVFMEINDIINLYKKINLVTVQNKVNWECKICIKKTNGVGLGLQQGRWEIVPQFS